MSAWWIFMGMGIVFSPWLIIWGLWLTLVLAGLGRARGGAAVRNRKIGVDVSTIDVLIPAHDEEEALPGLLESLRGQERSELVGTILVVADYCSDATAALARAAGVCVLERSSGPRGKPAAVRDGLAWLAAHDTAGSAVLFLDADCVCAPNLIEAVATHLAAGHSAVQAAYLLESPAGRAGAAGNGGDVLEELVLAAFTLKNVLRPRGLARLGLPCQLFGSGMALDKKALACATFEDHLIEDARLSQQLLGCGIEPVFVGEAAVTSPMPSDRAGLSQQRLRWEGGQTQTWAAALQLAVGLLRHGRWRALLALIDWAAPPLSLLVISWGVATATVVGGLWWSGTWGMAAMALFWPVVAAVCLASYLMLGVGASRGVGGIIGLVVHAPSFLLWKMGLYWQMVRGHGAKTWQRTPRGPVPGIGAAGRGGGHD